MRKYLPIFALATVLHAQDRFQIGSPIIVPPPSSGIVFSPPGGSSYGSTQFVGLSYPAAPSDSLVFTLGTLCTPSSCPAGSSVLTPASSLYTGPNCIPTSTCTTGGGGFGTAIKAPVTGSGTTINAQVVQTVVAQQNNLSTTSLPANWFPAHWKYITPNTLTTTSGRVATPTTGTCGNQGCAGNILSAVCYLTVVSPATGCKGGGVGSRGSVTTAWVIPSASAPVTPPIDATTGQPANATYIGFTSSSQDTSSYGHPQILYTEQNEQNCGATSVCTWMEEDFWILGDGSPVAAWESDMQIGDSVGAWTSALQCRVHGNASPLTAGWGYGNQSSGLTQIAGTTASNCPSPTAWLHVMYSSTLNPSAQTFTIVSLTLQSVPGGPAGATGYAVFPVNKTYPVDATHVLGTSCTNQMQIDQWCAPGNVCNTTQPAGAYYALNNMHCGTGTPPVAGTTTQIYQ